MSTPPLSTATAWGSQVNSFQNGAQPSANTGAESQDRAASNDWITAHESPSYYAHAAAIPGYSNYAAFKSMTGFGAKKSAWEDFKNERARGTLMKMTGEEGMAYGYKPGSRPLASSSTWAVAQQEAKTKRNEARVNMAYGYLPSMRNSNPYSIALNNNALIHGQVEQNVDMTRDAVSADNTANAEAGARQASFAAAEAGTTGSSMDTRRKQNVLGGYLNGRAGVNAAAAGTRSASNNALEQERLGAIDKVRGRSSIDLGQRVADLSTIRQLGEAQRQVVPTAIGNSLAMGGDMYARNSLYGAMINDPTRGASLPSLSGGTTRSTGGYRSP